MTMGTWHTGRDNEEECACGHRLGNHSQENPGRCLAGTWGPDTACECLGFDDDPILVLLMELGA